MKSIYFFLFVSTSLLGQSFELSDKLLSTHYIDFIYEDSYGLAWIGSELGLSIYDGFKYENIKKFTDRASGKDVSLSYIQSTFFEDSSKNIWFSVGDQIIQYDRGDHDFSIKYKSSEKDVYIHIFHKSENTLWFKESSRIGKYNLISQQITWTNIHSQGARFTFIKLDDIDYIIACPWVIAKGVEIYKLSPQDTINVKIPENLFQYEVSHAELHNECLYLFTDKGTIETTLDNIEENKLITTGTKDNQRTTKGISISKTKMLVLNNAEGLKLYDTSSKTFNDLPYNLLSRYPNIIKDPSRINLTKGHVWLSSQTDKPIRLNIDEILSNNSDLLPNQNKITSLEVMSNNSYFVSYENSVSQYNLEGGKVRSEFFNDKIIRIINFKNHVILFTRKKAYIFNGEKWEQKFDLGETIISILYNGSELDLYNGSGIIFKIDTNINGELLLEKTSLNAQFLNFKKHTFKLINNKELKHQNKGHELMTYTYEFVNNIRLIDSNHVAVCHVNGLDIIPLHISKEISKIDIAHQVYDIFTLDTNYFLTTSGGLYVIGSEFQSKGKIKIGSQLNRNSVIKKLGQDQYITHGSKIISLFSTEDISQEKIDINIQRVLVNDIPFKTNSNYNYINHFDLGYRARHISIYANPISLNENTSAHSQYSFDQGKSWTTNTSNSPINHTFESFGNFDITIVPIGDNNIKGHPKTIFITISPPFYQSWWFLLSVAGGLIGIGWYISHTLTKRKLKEVQITLEKQQALSAQREKIADDLHDELGTELNKILYLSDEAIYEKDKNEKEHILDNIGKLASESIHNMRDILWVLDNENDTLDSLIARTKVTLQKSLSVYKIRLISSLPDETPTTAITAEIRRHVLLIVKEACHNVIKHADANKVKLTVDIDSSTLLIIIKDDGKGITKERTSDNFGLSSMEKRARAIGGKLHIYSEPGQGVEVTLEIQLDKMTTTNDT